MLFYTFQIPINCSRMAPASSKFAFRKNSTFTVEQTTFIILKFGELKNITLVRRAFGTKFFPKKPYLLAKRFQFQRVIDRFLKTASASPNVHPGSNPTSQQSIQVVKDFFDRNPKAHIRQAVEELDMSFCSVWTILRKKLKFRPHRPHLAQMLSPANMQSRLKACNNWLTFTTQQFERILWSYEKWFVLNQAPNRKNDVVWSPHNTREVVQCKKAHGKKVMAWVGIVDGQVLPVHWFQGSVDIASYLHICSRLLCGLP